jgi:polyisoprenoid-binding protein YceI
MSRDIATQPIPAGAYVLGPDHATLRVRTGKGGAASKAGHNLLIEVGAWSATLQVADDPAAGSAKLTADSGSLSVIEGSGGMQALGDEEKSAIKQTIDSDILKGGVIEFRSSRIEADGELLRVHGELNLLGATKPVTFQLGLGGDGELTGRAIVTQTDFGIKPYSALFGTLKVLDDVEIELDGRLPAAA